MKKIIKLKNKYGMIVCVLFCMIYFCLGCGQEDETVFLEQKRGTFRKRQEKTNETEVEKESKPKESEESETEDRENNSASQEQICVFVCGFVQKSRGLLFEYKCQTL